MFGTKKCPYCRELIFKKAIICKHCKSDLSEKIEIKKEAAPIKSDLTEKSEPLKLEPKKKEGPTYSERMKAKIEEEKAKEKAHFESLSPEEKKLYLKEKKRKKKVNMLWFTAGFIAIFFYSLNEQSSWLNWAGFITLFIGIWAHPKKSEENLFKNRFKNIKEYKGRIVTTLICFVMTLIVFVPQISAEREEQRLLEEEEFIENYPVPNVEVLSSEGDQGEAKEYELKVKVEEATSVSANDEEMVQDPKDKNVYSLTVTLDSSEESINIKAENKYKETYEEIAITRTETEAEKTTRLALEAKIEEERVAREAKEAEEMAKLEESIKEAELKREEAEQASQDFKRQQEAFGTGGKEIEAYVCSKNDVEDLLKSPGSADFPFLDYASVYIGYNKYQVESYVDAQNGFGAMLRSNYRCVVEMTGDQTCNSVCELY